jgi:catalase (peroxidase I)
VGLEEVEWTQATAGQEDWNTHDASVSCGALNRRNASQIDPLRISTDYTMVSDKAFKKYAFEYAKSQDAFFRE